VQQCQGSSHLVPEHPPFTPPLRATFYAPHSTTCYLRIVTHVITLPHQGALVALTQACTSFFPEFSAAADVPAHQGASTAQSHISISKWPPIAAARHTEASQGAGGCCALSH
jgi:hypothetical protein